MVTVLYGQRVNESRNYSLRDDIDVVISLDKGRDDDVALLPVVLDVVISGQLIWIFFKPN